MKRFFCLIFVVFIFAGCGADDPLDPEEEDEVSVEMTGQQEDVLDPQSFGSFFEFQQARREYFEKIQDDELRKQLEAMTDMNALKRAYVALERVSVRREAAQEAAEASGDFSKIEDTYYMIIWEELGMKEEVRIALGSIYVSNVRHMRLPEEEQLRLWYLLGRRRAAESERNFMENTKIMDDLIAVYLMLTVVYPRTQEHELFLLYETYISLGGVKMRFPDFRQFPELADQFEDDEDAE